ncbi:hypothetical protein [Candidatus Formimonas warabiya]|uniref:Uncharacterized protein n=1 Tax=Formimonas warabiya TaxID=1761012 RepID=A0A3G1KQ35_FORW1|nr:hypothetical protein [Candidatus Formimonas warabiya]ATW24589.1 hypothetical protein DCMF_07135 [Candidatus Formimonas warabiya]
MEQILKEILAKLDNVERDVKGIKSNFKELQTEVKGIKKEHGQMLHNLEKDVKEIKEEHGQRLHELETEVKGIKEEHGLMLRAILESKEVQRGEIDTLMHRTAKIEGTIKGAAKQVIDDLKEASNQ